MWNTSLVPIQWVKPHDATKMPQLLCVKLEDPKKHYIPGPEAITCCHTPGPFINKVRSLSGNHRCSKPAVLQIKRRPARRVKGLARAELTS